MKKLKIYITPHTHWDREWMFTEQTGNVALNNYFQELEQVLKNDRKFKLVLDGQVSLLDNYLTWNGKDKVKELIKLLKKGKVSLGPWYSQPDVFSTLAETIFRNAEVAKETLSSYGLKSINTAYMPDTFGFNNKLPQIFKLNGLDTFVHWRGLNSEQMQDFALHYWKGIDGTKILASTYLGGYHALQGYHYGKIANKEQLETIVHKFIELTKDFVEKHFKSIKGNTIMLPLGWDQVPVQYNLVQFFDKVNELDSKHEWILSNDFNDFFNQYKNNENIPVFENNLDIAINGRVHKTIASSRYDIKKLFRKCETALYYRLEPLEILYKRIFSEYNFYDYKIHNIVKPLLIQSAHDSLGGCNPDKTNDDIMAKLKQIYENIMSLIDLITSKINKHENESRSKNYLLSFNLLPTKRDVYKLITVYSNKKRLSFESSEKLIYSLEVKDIGFEKGQKFKHLALIRANQIKGMSYTKWDLDQEGQKKVVPKNQQSFFKLDGDKISINLNKSKKSTFKFNFEDGNSDGYDYSPALKNAKWSIEHKVKSKVSFAEFQVVLLHSTLSIKKLKQSFETYFIKRGESVDIHIKTKNKLQENKVSLIFLSNEEIQKSHYLAISKYDGRDMTKNWEKTMMEYPVMVDYTDGLIFFKKSKLGILTRGNNEFRKIKSGLELPLYRTNSLVSNVNMKWRPGRPSGLTYREESESSKLLQEMSFTFRLFSGSAVENINNWNFMPLFSYHNNVHLTANRMNKFIINDLNVSKKVLKVPKIDISKVIISSLSLTKEGKVKTRIANPSNQKIKEFNPYQIKTKIT